jgi:chromosome segregation ATPase
MGAIRLLKEKLIGQLRSRHKNGEMVENQLIEEISCEDLVDLLNESRTETDSNDDLSSNLMSSVFAIVEERRKILTLLKDYKEQLAHSQSIAADILKEKDQLKRLLKEREEQLLVLQSQIEKEQDRYEELMEEHKLLRVNELNERVKLQQQIKELQANYESLNTEFLHYQQDKDREALEYKEMLRKEAEKYNSLQLKYDKLLTENRNLIEKVAVFAKQVSSVEMLNELILPQNEKPVNDKD